uniref:Peptidase M12B domain-containing protein n=1 Tax=Rhabditophanes sp. KR3021 TaxID=114890 RepID=A0AC35TZD0_9BILA
MAGRSKTSLFQLVDYRKKLMKVQTTDTTHLLTNVVFANGTIGKAYKGTMCANDFSVGVNMDHKDNAAFVASTVAHEMGHNFGMDHDPDDRKMYQCEGKTCLMHASSSHEMIYHWSDVSLNQLTTALNRGVNYCLLNVPKIKHGEPKCGNGIVEYGEECDCGSKLHCANDCCVASTCQLAKEAECAAGECCDTNTCKPKKRASLCRSPISDCDLPEYCDGNSQFCPMDFYVQDGSKCPLSEGSYCYSGICGDKDKQCAKLWGAEVHGSHEMCYTQLNTAGKYYGHCGYKNDTYFACSPKNALCGALMCDTEQQFAIYGDRQSILPANGHAYGKNNMDKKNCKSLRTTYSVNLKDKDPGMTPDGAPCGKDSFCVNTECRSKKNVTASLPLCSPGNCNNLGICNNVGNCHCEYGYGGIACEIPGYGGSINSGPTHDTAAFRPFLWVFWFTIIGIAMFIGATVYYKKKKDIWLPKIMWKKLRYGLNIRGVRVPVRRAPAPPSKLPKPNESLNAAWGDQPQVNATKGKHLVSSTFIPKPPSFDPPTCTYNASEKYVKFSSTKPYYTTDRPKMAPPVAPKEDSATYDCIENYDSYNEFSNSSEPPSQFYEPPNEVYTSNSNIYNDIPLNNGATIQRPCNPPPPIPKHKIKPPVAKKPQIINNTSLSNNIPPISEEPVVNNKIDVRSLAKRFENRN